MGKPRLYSDIVSTVEGQARVRWSSFDFSRLGVLQTSGGIMASPNQVENSLAVQTFPNNWGYTVFQETGGTTGDSAFVTQFPSALFSVTARPIWVDRFEFQDVSSLRFFSGFIQSTGSTPVDSDDPPVPHIGVQFSSDRGDTTLMVSSRDTAQVLTPTTAPPPAFGEVYQVEIYTDATAPWRVVILNVTTGAVLWAGDISAQLPLTSSWQFFSGVQTRADIDRNIGRHGTKIGIPGALLGTL